MLLAVLAGYSCLFAINTRIAEAERFDRHQRLVEILMQSLETEEISLPLPRALGVQARWAGSSLRDASAPFVVRQTDGQTWIESHSLQLNDADRDQLLVVRQNITADLSRQYRDQQLLVAAAGASALLTAMLLRLVLWRGLLLPLSLLSLELQQVRAQSLGRRSLEHRRQPEELRPIVEEFNDLQQRLAESWRRERSFVDSVAHELRTPITLMSGYAERLPLVEPEHQRHLFKRIAVETQRMGQLITSLLDLARGDAARLQLAMQVVEPEALLLESFERLQLLDTARLRLAVAPSERLDAVRLDAERLHQCLAALVENALRYSNDCVELAVDQQQAWIIFLVRDRGPGIVPEERELVVERFRRGTASIGTQGSGLGLALVRLLVEAMQGEMLIADRPGGGADLQLRFRVWDRPPEP